MSVCKTERIDRDAEFNRDGLLTTAMKPFRYESLEVSEESVRDVEARQTAEDIGEILHEVRD